MDLRSDTELMMLVSGEDESAFAEIYRRYNRRLVNSFYALTRDSHAGGRPLARDLHEYGISGGATPRRGRLRPMCLPLHGSFGWNGAASWPSCGNWEHFSRWMERIPCPAIPPSARTNARRAPKWTNTFGKRLSSFRKSSGRCS